jgi:hypothetical protein
MLCYKYFINKYFFLVANKINLASPHLVLLLTFAQLGKKNHTK